MRNVADPMAKTNPCFQQLSLVTCFHQNKHKMTFFFFFKTQNLLLKTKPSPPLPPHLPQCSFQSCYHAGIAEGEIQSICNGSTSRKRHVPSPMAEEFPLRCLVTSIFSLSPTHSCSSGAPIEQSENAVPLLMFTDHVPSSRVFHGCIRSAGEGVGNGLQSTKRVISSTHCSFLAAKQSKGMK